MLKLLILSALCLVPFVSILANADEIRINNWPEDVPCDVIRKNSNGSYTQMKDIVVNGETRTAGSILKDHFETRLWDRKCTGKTSKARRNASPSESSSTKQ